MDKKRKALLKKYLTVHLIMVFLFILVVSWSGIERFVYNTSRVLPIDERIKQSAKRDYLKDQYIRLNQELSRGGIVFLGNSIIYNYPLSDFFPGNYVVNRGIEGDTTGDIIARLDSTVLNLAPSKVFIMLGINDLLSGVNKEDIIKNYRAIIQRIQEARADSRIYLKSVLPLSKYKGDDYSLLDIEEINYHLFELSREHHNVVYIELRPLLTDEEGYLAERFSIDGKNLNITAYTLLSDAIKVYLKEYS